MPKPSELLIDAGWKPENKNAQPRDTKWIDPVSGEHLEFITAVIFQLQRDNENS